MTAPLLHDLPADVSTDLRRRFGRSVASSAVFVLVFTGGAAVGVVMAHTAWQIGGLVAGAFLAGAAISLGVLAAALRGRHAVVADGISIAAARRSQILARRCGRVGRIAVALTVVAAVAADLLLRGGFGQVVLGVASAWCLWPVASLARAIDRRWAAHLPNETPS